MLDRIDIHIHVPKLEYNDITGQTAAESSEKIRNRVEAARQIQRARFSGSPFYANAQMRHKEVRLYCKLSTDAQSLLENAFQKMNLSARGYDRILKVARTIADLSGMLAIEAPHIAEAIQFRSTESGVSWK